MLSKEEIETVKRAYHRAKRENDLPTLELIEVIVRVETECRKLRYGVDWEAAVRRELGI